MAGWPKTSLSKSDALAGDPIAHFPGDTPEALAKKGNRVTPPSLEMGIGRSAIGLEEGEYSRTKRKYALRRAAAKLLPEFPVSTCGRFPSKNFMTGEFRNVQIRADGKRANYCGMLTCGSVWVCPFCSAKVAAKRKAELEAIVGEHVKAGGDVFMATFTIPHNRFQKCKELRDAVAKAWTKVISGNPWVRQRDRHSIHWMRALEVTHGGNGWHPHIHTLLFTRAMTDAERDALDKWLFERWRDLVEKMGFGKPTIGAWDFKRAYTPIVAVDYLLKGVAWELTHGHLKKGKEKTRSEGGRTPAQILRDFEASPNKRDAALFQEFGEAFKGARQLTYSRGLRDLYDIPEPTDEELAAEPEGEIIAEITGVAYIEISRRHLEPQLLAAAMAGGWLGVFSWLEQQRLPAPIGGPSEGELAREKEFAE